MKALLRAGLAAATICLAISSAHALPPCAPMDFDGDCKSDVLWRNSATGEDYLWLMNGRTIATGGYLRTVGDPAWQIVGTGDFDGDGKADILWRNAVTGQNYIYLMNGLTIASEGSVNVVDPVSGWQVQGIGDFDGDGRDDVLWRNLATGENYIWLMNGSTIASGGLLRTVADQAWQVKGIGDFDGDGKADILWRNTVTGEDYAYFMNGSAIASEGPLNTAADLYWMPRSATTLADVTGWDTVAPSTPAGLTASAVSSSRVNLSWLAATDNVGVIRYGVYRNGVQIAVVAGTSYANTGLAAATTYSYTVLAYDTSWNASAQSSAVSATTKALADSQAPSSPTNLAATAVSSSQIDLSWSPATDNVGVTGYRVYRNGTLAASPTGTSVSIVGLSASTTYSFTVSAVDAAGNASALSAPLSATTPGTGGTVPTPYTGTPIAVPGSFEVENFDLGGEGVAYHDNTPGNQGGHYRITEDVDIVVSYDAPGGGYVVNNFETGEWLAYTINVAASAQYNIEIRASSELANSAFHVEIDGQDVTGSIVVPNTASWNTFQWIGKQGVPIAAGKHVLKIFADQQYFNLNSIRVMLLDTTAPTVPTGLAASAVTSTSLTLSWNASIDNIGVAGYRVYRDGTLVTSLSGTSASITGLSAGVPYSFTVSAFDASGNASALSAALSVTTLLQGSAKLLFSSGFEGLTS